MRKFTRNALLLGFALEAVCLAMAARASAEEPAWIRSEVQFTNAAPYSSGAEVLRRYGLPAEAPAYDLAREKFLVIGPAAVSTNAPAGALVWISPSDTPRIPADWDAELARRQMICVAAFNSGNERNPVDRSRLALDAAFNVCRQYHVDGRKVRVGGFSGGARMASMLGIANADIFSGALCVCGVNFFMPVPTGDGKFYPVSYSPDGARVARARREGRFVLLTGEFDVNLTNTKRVYEFGFKRESFAHVKFVEVPGMRHELPPVEKFGEALDFLATR